MEVKIHIVLAADANYAPGLKVTRESMERSCRHPERLEFHVFDEKALDGLSRLEVFDKYNTSKMPYLRLFLPEILSGTDWIVYSDVDTIWNRDVCELWDATVPTAESETQTSSSAIYWVRDFESTVNDIKPWLRVVGARDFDEGRYACSGVCVMNLRKMRETRLRERAVEIVRKCGTPPYADQDVLNLLYNHDSGLLPTYWDVLRGLDNPDVPCVYHLTGVGRHFHDETPPVYPPQYQFWWNVAHGERKIHPRSKLLAALWPLRFLTVFLPWRIRERIVRQWFFAKVLSRQAEELQG